ncbi:condensation domain-containing protein [Streptomyces venezuelae]|uniref:condensation domain-containing protein n=1 Tax=Streptomyces venezuelae TaxID=54571 RepID=UPI00378C98AA
MDVSRDEMFEKLEDVWLRVLGREACGADDNFFSLGGDSIIAIRLVAEARAAGLDLGVEEVFLYPTLGELARATAGADRTPPEAVDGSRDPAAPAAAPMTSLADLDPGLVPPGVEDAYPLSSLQLGILYHCELSEDAGLYHDLTGVRVTGPWDEAALEGALADLVVRHDILRTSFELADFQEPVQLVHSTATVPVETEDLRGLTEPEQNRALDAWWRRESATPFDVTAAPLLRVHVGLLDDTSFRLSLSVHHVLLDGWSFARLATELLIAYDHRIGGGDALAPMPASRYRDFVAAERHAAQDTTSRSYWSELLKGMRPLELPKPSGAAGADSAELVEEVPAELAAGARRVCAALGVPVKNVFLAAHLWAMGQLCDAGDVVTGLCGNGRPEAAGADLVLGVFLNVVPVRVQVTDHSWKGLVQAAFDAEREHLPHRSYPLARVTKELGEAPFEAMFNYTDFHVFGAAESLRGIEVGGWGFADRTNFPVLVEVNRLQERSAYELSIRVDPARVSADVPARLRDLWTSALSAIVRETL